MFEQYPGAYLRKIVKNWLDSTGPNCFCPLCAVCNSFTNLISARSNNGSFYLSRWLHVREQINVVDRKWSDHPSFQHGTGCAFTKEKQVEREWCKTSESSVPSTIDPIQSMPHLINDPIQPMAPIHH